MHSLPASKGTSLPSQPLLSCTRSFIIPVRCKPEILADWGLKADVGNVVQVHEGTCASLKRHKLDVERVGKGNECGVLLDGYKVSI